MQNDEKEPTTSEKAVSNTLGEGAAQKNVARRFLRVQFDIEYGGSVGKHMDSKSETMPDMHMTVRQLLENHSRGIDGKVEVRQPLYFDTEIPTLNDITDVQAFKESLEERLKQTNAFIKKEKAAAEAAKKAADQAAESKPGDQLEIPT